MNYPSCKGTCRQGHELCNCDPYEGELAPRFVEWIDSHPVLAPVLMVAFILLALGVAGWIDHGGPL